MAKILPRICLSLSILFFSHFLYLSWLRLNPKSLSFAAAPIVEIKNSDGKNIDPSSISIPSLSVSLPVTSAKITEGRWETSSKSVSYLVNSARPGDYGNSIFYAHNWPSLFGKLPQIKPGDNIEVLDKNGQKLVYRVDYTTIVDPATYQILVSDNDKKMLTVYTCIGFLDRQRFVVTAFLL